MGFGKIGERGVDRNLDAFAVIQSSPTKPGIVQIKSERFDQVQSAAGIGAKPDDVPGVRWNLGRYQDNIEQN